MKFCPKNVYLATTVERKNHSKNVEVKIILYLRFIEIERQFWKFKQPNWKLTELCLFHIDEDLWYDYVATCKDWLISEESVKADLSLKPKKSFFGSMFGGKNWAVINTYFIHNIPIGNLIFLIFVLLSFEMKSKMFFIDHYVRRLILSFK